MNDRQQQPPVSISISAVERDTGLSKDTLRVWERRYGFPQPARDAFGERIYSIEQVDKLRVIKRLMDVGHRPGKIIHHSAEQLHELAASLSASARQSMTQASSENYDLQAFLDLVKTHRVEDLRRLLSQTLLRIGLARFVTEVVAPLNEMVGDAWTRGWFEIFEEHLYTESIQVILRNAINTIPQPGKRPRVLLTTFPQEQHGLGLLMAEALLSLEGCRCISLGVQTPIWDIVLASTTQHADVVALSFSACLNPNGVLDGLSELRQKLPRSTEIWAGGSCPVLHRKPPADIKVFGRLDSISPAVMEWREQREGN
ncbi:MAG TPA: MerR family transcriptional regulator [Burkholderiaceae bacterium]|nr:MerR family transcriptional regulator [Burkholderiaceae bacterium]